MTDTGTDTADPGPANRTRWLRRAFDLALWAAVVALLVWRFGPQVGAALGIGATSDPAPPFAVETLDGDSLSLDAELSHGFKTVSTPTFTFLTVQAERRR